MNIGAIGSASNYKPLQRTTEASELKRPEKNDGDKDDQGAGPAAASASPTPTVNSTGQTVGQLIHAIA